MRLLWIPNRSDGMWPTITAGARGMLAAVHKPPKGHIDWLKAAILLISGAFMIKEEWLEWSVPHASYRRV